MSLSFPDTTESCFFSQYKEKAAPEPKVITLCRIAASHPHITVSLFQGGIRRTLLPEDKYQIGVFPRVLLCPKISSLLYSEPQKSKADFGPHNLILWVNYLNDKVLHSKDSKYTTPRELVQYYAAAYNSSVTVSEQRKFYCRRLGLINDKFIHVAAVNPLTPERTFFPANFPAIKKIM